MIRRFGSDWSGLGNARSVILSQIDSDFLRYLLTHASEPGTRLPSLDEISVKTGISVGKLREQLEVARTLQLVETAPRRGIHSRPYEFLPAIRLSLMIALGLDRHAFGHFSDLRTHLEMSFWDEAVGRLTDADKMHLKQLVERAQAKLNNKRIEIPHAEHRDFHLTIYSRLDNPFARGLLEAYWDGYEAVALNTYADYGYLQAVWDYHRRIVRAISEGDYATGKRLLAEHMRLIGQMGDAHELSVHVHQYQGEEL